MGAILVVDDDPVSRLVVSEYLRKQGYEVRVAEQGLDALDLLKAEPCDVLITDISMPEMDGFELMKAISLQFPQIPVIAMSSFSKLHSATIDYLEIADRLGVAATLAKPVVEKDLLETVKRILG